MASGTEWTKYFSKKSTPYLKKQIKLIESTEKFDKKIIQEFQLNYLVMVKMLINRILAGRKH